MKYQLLNNFSGGYRRSRVNERPRGSSSGNQKGQDYNGFRQGTKYSYRISIESVIYINMC